MAFSFQESFLICLAVWLKAICHLIWLFHQLSLGHPLAFLPGPIPLFLRILSPNTLRCLIYNISHPTNMHVPDSRCEGSNPKTRGWCIPLNIKFTSKVWNLDWTCGYTWDLRMFQSGADTGIIFTIKLLKEPGHSYSPASGHWSKEGAQGGTEHGTRHTRLHLQPTLQQEELLAQRTVHCRRTRRIGSSTTHSRTAVFFYNVIPSVGFGFLDNAIMIVSGTQIELSIWFILRISKMSINMLSFPSMYQHII